MCLSWQVREGTLSSPVVVWLRWQYLDDSVVGSAPCRVLMLRRTQFPLQIPTTIMQHDMKWHDMTPRQRQNNKEQEMSECCIFITCYCESMMSMVLSPLVPFHHETKSHHWCMVLPVSWGRIVWLWLVVFLRWCPVMAVTMMMVGWHQRRHWCWQRRWW